MLNNRSYRWRGHRKTFVGTKVLWPKRYKVFLPICINPQTSSIFLIIYFCALPLPRLQGAFKCCALTPPVLATSTCYGAQVNPSALPSMRPAIFLNERQSICLKLTLNLPQAIFLTSQKSVKWIRPSARLYPTPVGLLAPWEGRLQGWVRPFSRANSRSFLGYLLQHDLSRTIWVLVASPVCSLTHMEPGE